MTIIINWTGIIIYGVYSVIQKRIKKARLKKLEKQKNQEKEKEVRYAH